MSVELGITAGTGIAALLLAYIGINFGEKHGEVKSFYIGMSQLLGIGVLFQVAEIAGTNYENIQQVTYYLMYVAIIVFVMYVFYIIYQYFKDSINLMNNAY